ncbi:MAG TPA: UDP-N-acetylmuramate--L-alanine ligase [Desulfurobacteriaceae bacterium]|nr:UDP-N-acetylmuramate--L-alanine ligase [Desulfurobacteriaceae bacterium]
MKYYLIGISGIGMSALAFMLKDLGYEVIGSTKEKNYICSLLEENGIKVIYGHKEDNITKDIDFVVYSSAIKKDHIELKRAKRLSLALLHRSDLLKDLINLHKKNILVTGTHGKTTTTSLISYIFYKAKRNFSSYIGGLVDFLNKKNAILDKSFEMIICEADESDKSFLKYNPYYTVITNIDEDHLDFYLSKENIKKTFLKFINSTNTFGKIFLSLENSFLDENFLKNIKRKFVYISKDFNEKLLSNKYLDYILSYQQKNKEIYLYKNNKLLFSYKLNLPGKHNILNSILAAAVALENNIPISTIKEAFLNFKNAKRRLEVIFKDENMDITLIDDYAHHPKELQATFEALLELFKNKNIFVIFQPHRYSRFYKLQNDFLKVLEKYKKYINIFITDVYSAGESLKEFNINIKEIAEKLNIKYITHPNQIPIKPSSVYASIGAGDIYKWLLELKQKILLRKF